MDIGLLWHDDDKKRDLAAKIIRGADFYRAKYNAYATTCYINPAMLPAEWSQDGKLQIYGIKIKTSKTVLLDHFWYGVEGEAK